MFVNNFKVKDGVIHPLNQEASNLIARPSEQVEKVSNLLTYDEVPYNAQKMTYNLYIYGLSMLEIEYLHFLHGL